MLHRRRITTKRDGFDYFDAMDRASDIARAAHSREMAAWHAKASLEERLAAIDITLGRPVDDPDVHDRVAAELAEINRRRDRRRHRYLALRFVVPGDTVQRRPLPPRPRCAGRPRSRRHRGRARTRAPAGETEGDGDGAPPPALLRALRRLGLTLSAVRWCRRCKRFAFAVDDYQREQLDALGFRDGLCPDCRQGTEP